MTISIACVIKTTLKQPLDYAAIIITHLADQTLPESKSKI